MVSPDREFTGCESVSAQVGVIDEDSYTDGLVHLLLGLVKVVNQAAPLGLMACDYFIDGQIHGYGLVEIVL